MKLELDGYSKFILTVIAIALILNAITPLAVQVARPAPAHAAEVTDVRIVDVRTTWPQKIEITNWPSGLSRR
jgi:hypothetical protein